jgi:hypothetical protein
MPSQTRAYWQLAWYASRMAQLLLALLLLAAPWLLAAPCPLEEAPPIGPPFDDAALDDAAQLQWPLEPPLPPETNSISSKVKTFIEISLNMNKNANQRFGLQEKLHILAALMSIG